MSYSMVGLSMAVVMSVYSGSASSETTVRLVVEHLPTVQMVSAQSAGQVSQRCIPTPDHQGEWCLPLSGETAPMIMSQSVRQRQQSTAQASTRGQFSVVELDLQGWPVDVAIEAIQSSNWYGTVEPDVIVQTGPIEPRLASAAGWSAGSGAVNDPVFDEQGFYFGNKPITRYGRYFSTYHDILGAWSMVRNPEKVVDVIVLDSGFYLHSDIHYDYGLSFVEVNNQQRSSQFLEDEFRDGFCNPHGLVVSSVTAAGINNGDTMAGIVNDIRLHAVRVMDCNTGSMFDVSEALKWVAGNEFYDGNGDLLPAYQGEPGVINLSLSAHFGGGCPHYLQSSINEATDAGFVIIVAAGNNTKEAAEYIPAACDNVITVGSLDERQNLASFSNFGDAIDVMALGEEVVALHTLSDYVFSSGTSVSAPIVSGLVALGMKDLAGSWQPEWFTQALTASSKSIDDSNGDCASKGCGYGNVNASGFIQALRAVSEGTLSTAEPALAVIPEDEHDWYISHFGQDIPFCELTRLQFLGGKTPLGQYVLYRQSHGQTNSQPDGVFYDGDVVIAQGAIDPSNSEYFFKDCPVGEVYCDGPLQPISTIGMNTKLAACQ